MTRDMHDGIGRTVDTHPRSRREQAGVSAARAAASAQRGTRRPASDHRRSRAERRRLACDPVELPLRAQRTAGERGGCTTGVGRYGSCRSSATSGRTRRCPKLFPILQEATTNVLRHAQATQLTVRTGTVRDEDGRTSIVVDIADNGHGYADAGTPGRGLGNMRRRAQMLGGAAIELHDEPGRHARAATAAVL